MTADDVIVSLWGTGVLLGLGVTGFVGIAYGAEKYEEYQKKRAAAKAAALEPMVNRILDKRKIEKAQREK